MLSVPCKCLWFKLCFVERISIRATYNQKKEIKLVNHEESNIHTIRPSRTGGIRTVYVRLTSCSGNGKQISCWRQSRNGFKCTHCRGAGTVAVHVHDSGRSGGWIHTYMCVCLKFSNIYHAILIYTQKSCIGCTCNTIHIGDNGRKECSTPPTGPVPGNECSLQNRCSPSMVINSFICVFHFHKFFSQVKRATKPKNNVGAKYMTLLETEERCDLIMGWCWATLSPPDVTRLRVKTIVIN